MKANLSYFLLFFTIHCSTSVLAADPTFTFGPVSNYFKTVKPTATPTGGDISIVPRDNTKDIPKDGVDIYIGPDVQKAFTGVFKGVCAKGLSDSCVKALAETADTNHAGTIAARFVVSGAALLIWGSFAVIGIALWLGQTNNIQAVPAAVHLESSDIAQLQSYTSTSFVFATPSATAPMTITKPPTLTATVSSATIKTLTADDGKHHKGDVVISLPKQPADLMLQVINKWGGHDRCQNITQKRGPSRGSVNRQAVFDSFLILIPMAAPGQLLDALGLGARQVLPQFRDAADRAAVVAAQQAAAALQEFRNLAPALINNIAQVVYMAVADVCSQAVTDLAEIVAEEWQFEDQPQDKEGKCSNDELKQPLCDSSFCNGQHGKCTVGENKDCKCLKPVTPYDHPANMTFWDAAQQVIDQMTQALGTPHCDSTERMTLRKSDFEKLVDNFCKGADLSKDFSKDLIASDADVKGYPPYTFSFKWKHQGNTCSHSCDSIFKSFVNTDSCARDNDKIAMSASNDVYCGTASYTFKNGSKTVAGGPSIFKNEGNLDCGTQTDPGNAQHFVSVDMMDKAADFFCEKMTHKEHPMILQPGKVPNDQKRVELHYNNYLGDPVYIKTEWIDDPGCPTTDFGKENAKSICLDRLHTVVHGCDTSNDKSYYWWKQGGSFFRDCISWNIRRDTWVYTGLAPGGSTTKDTWRPGTHTCNEDRDCTSSAFNNLCAGSTRVMCKHDSEHTELGWCYCDS